MSRATIIIWVCGVVLWAIVSQLNHYLAPLNMSLMVDGLFVTFVVLRLPFREGWWALLLLGLFLDTPAPVPFGWHAALFLLTQAIVVNVRHRLAREETLIAIVVALLTNLGIFLAMGVTFSLRGQLVPQNTFRLLVDLMISQLLVILISPWFFALQAHTLEFFGVSLRREQQGGLL